MNKSKSINYYYFNLFITRTIMTLVKTICSLTKNQKTIINDLIIQKMGCIAGSIFYPTVSISGYPFFLYTPVCVGIHYISYKQNKKLFDHELKSILPKDHKYKYYTIPHCIYIPFGQKKIDDKANITFYENPIKIPLISLSSPSYLTTIYHKIDEAKNDTNGNNNLIKIEKTNTNITINIPWAYLKDNLLNEINELYIKRKQRFRLGMMSLVTTITLSSYANLSMPFLLNYISGCDDFNMCDIYDIYDTHCTSSIITLLTMSAIVAFLTPKLYIKNITKKVHDSLKNYKKLSDIINENYIKKGLNDIDLHGYRWYISSGGDFVLTNSMFNMIRNFRMPSDKFIL